MRIEYRLVDEEQTPIGTLQLVHYVAETGESGHEIRIDGEFLMASHGAVGERALPVIGFDRLACPRDGLRVLVGGLGSGHTLRATLDLPRVSEVVVVEVGARVFDWNRSHFAEVNGRALFDPRVVAHVGDLRDWLRAPAAPVHLALLDVDNGPGWLAAERNAGLYEPAGLRACRDALVPGGVVAIWCPAPNESLRASLEEVFGQAEAVEVGSPPGDPAALTDTVYCARAKPR